MKTNNNNHITYSILIKSVIFLLILAAYSSCKKERPKGTNEDEIVSPSTGTRTEFTLDSIFLYAKQIYLWNDVLPSYSNFNPREKYSNTKPELSAIKNELFDISQLKLNPVTGKPFEISSYNSVPKYSYLQIGRSNSGGTRAGVINGEAVLARRIIELDDKVIAYVALGSFPSLINAQLKLDQVFNEMAAAKPKYLILDLRSNGGGYVETAEYVANLITPSALNGKIMYSEQFNQTLQNGKATILRHQPYLDEKGKTVIYNGRLATLADVDYTENGNTYKFNKKGTLESIQDVYIIVSGQTASASELLISCLKPYFNVKLIGETTYGKPVGFFGVNIDQYSVYLSSFLIKNAQGWSDYFNGMEPDLNVVGSANPILGDPEERCLKSTLSAIRGEIQLAPKKTAGVLKGNVDAQSSVFSAQDNVGMIENRLRLKH
ncbi:carboxyl-terminal protease [Pedobacter sp. ISL-68]|uniref:S41 family peptidase n=1 Tax=unclassified Pedobacter TaxID=2628915 RepID=UPI001BE6A12E|nr:MULTISPECIES: S41 family peptidase [unclassified Pedobacter]MBT2559661.1 carboxyl-terminal protease [Pedobacter sp. ISL-64]MBT2591966.1 carboxyl-terminal protease [Pedobacter sp. ISL-68]